MTWKNRREKYINIQSYWKGKGKCNSISSKILRKFNESLLDRKESQRKIYPIFFLLREYVHYWKFSIYSGLWILACFFSKIGSQNRGRAEELSQLWYLSHSLGRIHRFVTYQILLAWIWMQWTSEFRNWNP